MDKVISLSVVLLCLTTVHSDYVTDDFLFFTDRANNVIWQVDLIQWKLHVIYQECDNPISVSYDPIDQRMYWTDVAFQSKIRRVSLDGSLAETVFQFGILKVPDGIAVDHISRLLYYTEATGDVIGVMKLDGSNHKVLLSTGFDKPRAITLDPVNGWMYWTDWGTEAKIERATMDGRNRSTVVDTALSWPNDIYIDIPAQKLYWTDGNYSKIEVSNTDGTDRSTLIKANDTVGGHYFGIAVDAEKFYFTDWRFTSWSFHRANKQDGSNSTVATASFIPSARLTGIHVYRSSYHLDGSNACSLNNGGCEYLCLPKPNGRTCACPDELPGCDSTTTTAPTTTTTTTSTTTTTPTTTTTTTTPTTTTTTTPTTTTAMPTTTKTTPTTTTTTTPTTTTTTTPTTTTTTTPTTTTTTPTTTTTTTPTTTTAMPTITTTTSRPVTFLIDEVSTGIASTHVVSVTSPNSTPDDDEPRENAVVGDFTGVNTPLIIGVAVATPVVTVALVLVIILVVIKRLKRVPPPDPPVYQHPANDPVKPFTGMPQSTYEVYNDDYLTQNLYETLNRNSDYALIQEDNDWV